MRTLLALSLVVAGLLFTPSRCFSLMSIGIIGKERARELGIELRIKENGPSEVWVEMEFKPEGDLKHFQHVSLEIREGEKFLVGYTPLHAKRTGSGTVVVSLMANRVFLNNVSLRIVTGLSHDLVGYDLKVKDFMAADITK